MKKWIGAVIGIVALLVGMSGGYLLSPEISLWMAEMETGENLIGRTLSSSCEIAEQLVKTDWGTHLLEDWQESYATVQMMMHDRRVLAEMKTNPAYNVLAVEDEYPFVRIVSVVEHTNNMEVWMYIDLSVVNALYSEKEVRNQARFDATGATIRLIHESFPDVERLRIYWVAFPQFAPCVEGSCYILGCDISIVGGQELFEWAENPGIDALIALVEADKVFAMQHGRFVPPEYCKNALPRLSDDPHPWTKKSSESSS